MCFSRIKRFKRLDAQMSIILSQSRNIFQWIRKPMSNRKQSIDLFCKSKDWFLYNRDLRHEKFKTLLSAYTEILFLHVVKHILLFLVFVFFYLAFVLRMFTIHKTVVEWGGYLLISFLPLPPASQTLRHYLGYCCRELTFAHNWQPGSNMGPLVNAR